MRIFNYRLFSQKRLDKIISMISGIKEDQELAKELLTGKKKKLDNFWPKYRIEVGGNSVALQIQYEPGISWDRMDSDSYTTEEDKALRIKRYGERIQEHKLKDAKKREIEQFNKYYINF